MTAEESGLIHTETKKPLIAQRGASDKNKAPPVMCLQAPLIGENDFFFLPHLPFIIQNPNRISVR